MSQHITIYEDSEKSLQVRHDPANVGDMPVCFQVDQEEVWLETGEVTGLINALREAVVSVKGDSTPPDGRSVFQDASEEFSVLFDPDDEGLPIGVIIDSERVWLTRGEALDAANAILKSLGWKPEAETATLEARPIGGDIAEAISVLGDRLVDAIRAEQTQVGVGPTFALPLPEAGSVVAPRDFSSPLAAQESGDAESWNLDALVYAEDFGLRATFLYRAEDDPFPHQRVVEIESVDEAGYVYGYDIEDDNQYKGYRLDRIYGYALVLPA